jgi:hypothetical protein
MEGPGITPHRYFGRNRRIRLLLPITSSLVKVLALAGRSSDPLVGDLEPELEPTDQEMAGGLDTHRRLEVTRAVWDSRGSCECCRGLPDIRLAGSGSKQVVVPLAATVR